MGSPLVLLLSLTLGIIFIDGSSSRTVIDYNPDETKIPYLVQQPRDTAKDFSGNNTKLNCSLRASNRSKGHFRHMVYYHNLNFVYLHINTSEDVIINSAKHVIGPTVWTWTFAGTEGALEFLSWPIEFGIWSMGLLNTYVMNLPVQLERNDGNCDNVSIGEVPGNTAISEALVELVQTLIPISTETEEKYGPSFFCYKERMFINPSSLYTLCKHIVCPYEAVQYQCCPYFYNQVIQKRKIDCEHGYRYQYDNLWWVAPILVSLIIFAYLPLLIMNISARVTITQRRISEYQDPAKYLEMGNISNFVFYDGEFHITLFNTLFSPLINITLKFQSNFARGVRFLLPWLSLSFIGLQVLLDKNYLSGFVLDSVKRGAPMGFRSMLAGYYDSSCNFLPYLGGPCVALGMYIAVSCTFIILPKSLSDHLELGINDNNSDPVESPLMLGLRQKEMLGSVEFHTNSGYKKIYNITLAQFYMLLNREYWSHAMDIQIQRWGSQNKSVVCLCLFPLYILFCVLEHTICVLFYGLPVVFFAVIITRSYYRCIVRIKHANTLGRLSLPCVFFLMIILVVCVALFLFMFCTVFLDACLFFTRLFIFTYTGIVVYPKSSYGYLIFALTIVYYMWDCVKDFSLTYSRILKATIKVCLKLQRANDRQPNVIKVGLFRGVRESILEHVIERICPRRKRAFLSVLKLCIILGAIGVSLGLLTKTDSFRELHVLVHVTTALFTCAVPRIAKLMFGKVEDNLRRKIFEDKVKQAVCEKISDPCFSIQEDNEPDSD